MTSHWYTSAALRVRRYALDVVWADVKTWSLRAMLYDRAIQFILIAIAIGLIAAVGPIIPLSPTDHVFVASWLTVLWFAICLGLVIGARWWLVLLIGTTVWSLAMLVLTTLSLMQCVGQ